MNKNNSITCENCNLINICIPKGFNRFEIGELALLVSHNHIRQKGDAIYHAGSPYRGMIAIRSGSAKLINYGQQGHELIVDFVLPGEIIGFDGLASQTYNCTALALETVNFCHLPVNKIKIYEVNNPHINQILLERSCAQYNAQVERMLFNKYTAEERVANFLFQISERLMLRGYSEIEFRLSMSREEIGNYLGITHETVSRIFHLFQDRDLIELKSKHVKILNKKKLLKVIN